MGPVLLALTIGGIAARGEWLSLRPWVAGPLTQAEAVALPADEHRPNSGRVGLLDEVMHEIVAEGHGQDVLDPAAGDVTLLGRSGAIPGTP